MSAVHQSPYWQLQKENSRPPNRVTIGNAKYPCVLYKPLSFESGFLLSACSGFIDVINQRAREEAGKLTDKIKSGAYVVSNPSGYFACDLSKFVEVLLTSSDLVLAKNLLAQRSGLFELEDTLILKVIPKIRVIVEGFFKLKRMGDQPLARFFFHKLISLEDLNKWAIEFKVDTRQFIYEKIGMECLGEANLPDSVMKELEKVKTISCFEYALAKIDPATAKVFRQKFKTEDIENCLIEMNWRNVPSPDRGDLVIYYNDQTGESLHAGIYLENGRVESKPGKNTPLVYEHDLYDFMDFYGNGVYFMRKSKASI